MASPSFYCLAFLHWVGASFPASSCPTGCEWSAWSPPHAWALDAYQDLLVRGYNFLEVLPKVGILGAFAVIFFGIIFLTCCPLTSSSLAASIYLLITLFVVGAIGRSWPQQQYCFVLASFRIWIYFKEIKVRDDTSFAPVRPNCIDKYLA